VTHYLKYPLKNQFDKVIWSEFLDSYLFSFSLTASTLLHCSDPKSLVTRRNKVRQNNYSLLILPGSAVISKISALSYTENEKVL